MENAIPAHNASGKGNVQPKEAKSSPPSTISIDGTSRGKTHASSESGAGTEVDPPSVITPGVRNPQSRPR